jgi:hypothetical protein
MAEHENGCWTNHHSIVNYKGQWYLFYHHNAFSPEFDKNRSAQIDRLYFNPDGTIREVKPTFRGVGPIKAAQRVQIDRYSSIDGAVIEYLDTADYFKGWKTVFAKAGDKVCFNEVDFGKKAPKKVVMRVKAGKDAVVNLAAGDAVVSMTVPETKDWTEVEFNMTSKVKDVQDLSLTLISDPSFEVDWIQFK